MTDPIVILGSSRARKESIAAVPELGCGSVVHPVKSSPQLNDLVTSLDRLSLSAPGSALPNMKWRGSVGNCSSSIHLPTNTAASSIKDTCTGLTKLGPGQIHPKGYRLTPGRYGELKIGFLLAKGILEIEVSFFSDYVIAITSNVHPSMLS